MTTKNCANGPKLVLKDLCENSFVRNVRLPLKTCPHLSYMIKRESLMFSFRQNCLDFPIFTMTDCKCLEHMTSSTLVKCNSMIISIVMPSYPNVTLFLCYISEH